MTSFWVLGVAVLLTLLVLAIGWRDLPNPRQVLQAFLIPPAAVLLTSVLMWGVTQTEGWIETIPRWAAALLALVPVVVAVVMVAAQFLVLVCPIVAFAMTVRASSLSADHNATHG